MPASFQERTRRLACAALEDQPPKRRCAIADNAVAMIRCGMWREIEAQWSAEICASFEQVADRLATAQDPQSQRVRPLGTTLAREAGAVTRSIASRSPISERPDPAFGAR